jgi:hypothetical protein
MPSILIVLDNPGMGQVAKGKAMQDVVKEAADKVAANVADQGHNVGPNEPVPVTVGQFITDRARATVSLAHPAGLAIQAKHGALTKAAAQAGLDVTGKST